MARARRTASTPPGAKRVASVFLWIARAAALATVLCVVGMLEPRLDSAEPRPRASVEFVVRVTDADSGRELTGAEVTLHAVEADTYRSLGTRVAGAGGLARFEDPGGAKIVVARAFGYARSSLSIEAGGERECLVMLRRARALRVDVRGRNDDGSSPLAGATVLLDVPEGTEPLPYARATEADGSARFDELPEGELRARIFARGYAPYEARVNSDLLVELSPMQGLLVRVVDGGAPVSGATVRISGPEVWPEREVSTGEGGEVRVQGLSAGTYVLEAVKGERVSPPLFGFSLAPGLGDERVTLELREGLPLDVEVVDDVEAPVGGARVAFSRDGLGLLARYAETDVLGRAHLAPLHEARGTVLVAAEGHVERVAVLEGPGPHRVVLDRVGTLTVEVVDGRGYPVAGVAVSVVGIDRSGMPVAVFPEADRLQRAHFDWQRGSERRLVPAGELGVLLGPVPPIPLAQAIPSGTLERAEFLTDSKGRVTIARVAPGQLRALAKHPDYLDGTSEAVPLLPAGQARARIVLGAGKPLRFRILDHRDFPVSDARVSLSGPGLERVLPSSPDGTYRAPVAPGRVTVRVSRALDPLRILLEEVVAVPEKDDEVTLRLPAPREASRVVVVDERGEPLPLTQVQLASRDARTPVRETRFTSERGELEFPGVRGLSCELSVSHPGYLRETWTRTLGEEERLTLVRALALTGKVTVARGRQPAAGARVTVRGPGLSKTLVADGLGEYSLSDAAPGRYLLEAELEGLRGKATVVVARSKEPRPIDLPGVDLARPVRVRVRVVDDRGFPVAGAWVGAVPLAPYRTLAEAGGEPRTGADGTLEVDLGETETELFAAAPGVGFGHRRTGELRDGAEVEVALSSKDEVPPGTVATVSAGLGERDGRVVVAVLSLGSEEAEQLRPGDAVLEIDREPAESVEHARGLLSGPAGTRVRVRLRRGGHELTLSLERRVFVHGPRG